MKAVRVHTHRTAQITLSYITALNLDFRGSEVPFEDLSLCQNSIRIFIITILLIIAVIFQFEISSQEILNILTWSSFLEEFYIFVCVSSVLAINILSCQVPVHNSALNNGLAFKCKRTNYCSVVCSEIFEFLPCCKMKIKSVSGKVWCR